MPIVFANGEIQVAGNHLRGRYNDTGDTVGLYVNDHTPTVNSVMGSFTKASYPGYADQGLYNVFTGPTQVYAGKWRIQSSLRTFNAPSSGGSVTVYGFFVWNGTTYKYAERFATPIAFAPGYDPIEFRIRLHARDESV